MNKLILIGTGIAISLSSFAQNEMDALRYSQLQHGGTARFSAMGGAFGSLGGDMSTLGINPAGIAVYRKSEFTFTPVFYNQISKTDYYGNSVTDSKYNFNIGNIGWVGTFDHGSSGFVSSNFGIAYSKINNFHRRYTMEAVNNESSLIDVYLNEVKGVTPSTIESDPAYAFGANLAWWTYLIDVDTSGNYFSAIPNYGETQKSTVTSRGSMGETVFTYGGNYENKLYLGGTFGIQNIFYSEKANYEEFVNSNDTTTTLQSFMLRDKLTTSGSGYNIKFGLIYRIHDYVRIGAAVHSPAFFNLTDSWGSEMTSEFDSASYKYASPNGIYKYQLTTPFRAIGSISVIFGKAGLISADYEFVDYASARLRSDDYPFSDENNAIENNYIAASNIRVGTEWKYAPFSFRGGFAYYGSPYSTATGNDGSKMIYSAGFGIREKGYFLDLTYLLSQSSEKYYVYDPQLVEATNISSSAHSFLVTIGFRY